MRSRPGGTTSSSRAAVEFPDVGDGPTPSPVRLEELLLIRVANENPAVAPAAGAGRRLRLSPGPDRGAAMAALEALPRRPCAPIGPNGETLVELLRAPGSRASPRRSPASCATSASTGAACWVRELDALLDRLLTHDRRPRARRSAGSTCGSAVGRGRWPAATGRGEAPDLTGLRG